MIRIVWTPTAETKRDAALDYIAQDNVRAALGQLNEIERQVDLLLDQPNMGRHGRRKGTRELVISRTPFIVVYTVQKNTIQIIRFLHTAQNS
jgi:toxin ParE1/3/4